MGNAVPRQAAAPAQQIYIEKPERHLIEDMRSVMVVARIGNGRFLKTYPVSYTHLTLPTKA